MLPQSHQIILKREKNGSAMQRSYSWDVSEAALALSFSLELHFIDKSKHNSMIFSVFSHVANYSRTEIPNQANGSIRTRKHEAKLLS